MQDCRKNTIIYCYRMTHDYGINPCVFTENYKATPSLLTEGGCMKRIRQNINKYWKEGINAGSIDAYLLAIAGKSNDKSRPKEERGNLITPNRNNLVFVAKISNIMRIEEYLDSEISNNRRDRCTYSNSIKVEPQKRNEIIILSKKFCYFGKSAIEVPQNIIELFPYGERAMLNGKKIAQWNPKNGFYNLYERPLETKELISFINSILTDENIVEKAYHPIERRKSQ